MLFDYTAFLALETGDTLKVPASGSQTGLPIAVTPVAPQPDAVTCYPDPFTADLTISVTDGLDQVAVYDITGRLVLAKTFAGKANVFVWNGKEGDRPVPPGVYALRIRTAKGLTTIRAIRQ